MNFSDHLTPNCALFLDFDGTLVDIAPQPDAVVVPQGLVETLSHLQQFLGGAVAVISGRPIEQLDLFLRPLKLPVAGVHGAERRRADGAMVLLAAHPLDRVEQAANALAREHPGLQIETKRGSLALHYRNAPHLEELCVAAMQAAVDQSPGLALLRGKMVAEAKPSGVSKGHAINDFMSELPFAGRTPVFIGDDVTDEVGFSAVQRRGGLGVKVGEGATVASHRMADPGVMRNELELAINARRHEVAR